MGRTLIHLRDFAGEHSPRDLINDDILVALGVGCDLKNKFGHEGYKDKLKNISHLGSLIADWAATELLLRAGILKARARYIAIKNHTYAHEHKYMPDLLALREED